MIRLGENYEIIIKKPQNKIKKLGRCHALAKLFKLGEKHNSLYKDNSDHFV